MPGPLPDPAARRRNAPTIPTTVLPANGYQGPIPEPPDELFASGREWWDWAWRTPQAAAWDAGSLYHITRRAQLADRIAALDFADELDLSDLLAGADREAMQRVEWALTQLKKAAGGVLAVEKEMRELEGRLGLNPEAMAKLRWSIVPVEDAPAGSSWSVATSKPAKIRTASHLRAVDPALVGE